MSATASHTTVTLLKVRSQRKLILKHPGMHSAFSFLDFNTSKWIQTAATQSCGIWKECSDLVACQVILQLHPTPRRTCHDAMSTVLDWERLTPQPYTNDVVAGDFCLFYISEVLQKYLTKWKLMCASGCKHRDLISSLEELEGETLLGQRPQSLWWFCAEIVLSTTSQSGWHQSQTNTYECNTTLNVSCWTSRRFMSYKLHPFSPLIQQFPTHVHSWKLSQTAPCLGETVWRMITCLVPHIQRIQSHWEET
jgi:hypothetical protein